MTAPSTVLYGITVHVWTHEDDGITKAQWDAAPHQGIDIKSAVDPEAKDQYSREELHAAFTWVAGVLARVALQLSELLPRIEGQTGHRCKPIEGYYGCGIWGDNRVVFPRTAVDEESSVPSLTIHVPTERVEGWAGHVRKLVGWILADDLNPLEVEAPHDSAIVLHETVASQPHKATA